MRVWMLEQLRDGRVQAEQLQEIGSSKSLSSSRAWRRGKTQQGHGLAIERSRARMQMRVRGGVAVKVQQGQHEQ